MAAAGANSTTPIASATAVAAWLSRAPASSMFHSACTNAAARASASAEAGIGGLHTGVLAVLILFDIDGTLVPGRPEAHQDALVRALVEVYGIEARDGENPIAGAGAPGGASGGVGGRVGGGLWDRGARRRDPDRRPRAVGQDRPPDRARR